MRAMEDPSRISKNFEDALATLQYVLIARRVQASDEPMRLNWRHFDIMELIKKHGSITPSTISKTLDMSRSSTAKYLKGLEEKELIQRDSPGSDRRSYQVALTKQADEILDNIYKGQRENARKVQQVLSVDEMKQFVVIAAKITAALDDDSLHTV